MPHIVSLPVVELWASANLAWSLCHMLTLGAVMAIENHASEDLKAAYLPKMISGEWTGTMNLTEPQAGSDLAAIRSRAVPDGATYRITGTKSSSLGASTTSPKTSSTWSWPACPTLLPGVKGISLFVVPKFLVNEDGSLGARNDLVCSSIEHKLGIHGSPTAVMSFGDKGGATGYLVGEANRGLEYMFTMMNHARINVGLQGVAIAERAYQQARDYARDRIQASPHRPAAPPPSRTSDVSDVARHEGAQTTRAIPRRAARWFAFGRRRVHREVGLRLSAPRRRSRPCASQPRPRSATWPIWRDQRVFGANAPSRRPL